MLKFTFFTLIFPNLILLNRLIDLRQRFF